MRRQVGSKTGKSQHESPGFTGHHDIKIDTSPPVPASAIAFRPEYLDFRRGIHVGNLEENERITRILKLALEARYRQPFVTERWGRGVYWQWIGYLPRANRESMPLSSHVSFGCSKFFLSVDTEEKLFNCGMQVERGYIKAPRDNRDCQLQSGLGLEPPAAFTTPRAPWSANSGGWCSAKASCFTAAVGKMRRAASPAILFPPCRSSAVFCPPRLPAHWAGFQVYYSMTESESCSLSPSPLKGLSWRWSG